MTDALLESDFPSDELNVLKQRVRSLLTQQRSTTAFLASEHHNIAVYGDHPARIMAPTPAALDAITPEDLKKWREERYSPENTIVGIAGDVRAAEVVSTVTNLLAGWQRSGRKAAFPRDPAPPTKRNMRVVDLPNSQQTSLMVGNIATNRRSPDLFAVLVANQILGGNPAGRLFVNLREQKGYTYGAYSIFAALTHAAPWRAYAEVRNEAAEPALQALIDETQRLQKEQVPEAELSGAKRSIAASFALSLEDPNELLTYLVASSTYGYSKDYWDNYPSKIMAVTAGEVQHAAQSTSTRIGSKLSRPVMPKELCPP